MASVIQNKTVIIHPTKSKKQILEVNEKIIKPEKKVIPQLLIRNKMSSKCLILEDNISVSFSKISILYSKKLFIMSIFKNVSIYLSQSFALIVRTPCPSLATNKVFIVRAAQATRLRPTYCVYFQFTTMNKFIFFYHGNLL
jgi:hypothetical protein